MKMYREHLYSPPKKGQIIMKKIVLSLLLISIYSTTFCADDNDSYSSHTFLFPRPAFSSLGMQQGSWHALAYEKEHKKGGALQVTAFYEQSYETLTAPAYFGLHDKSKTNPTSNGRMNVSVGTDTPNNYTQGSIYTKTVDRDVLGQWIGITTPTFSDSYSVTPQQRQAGFIFEYSQDLKDLFDVGFLRYLYVNVSLPVTLTENTLKFDGPDEIFDAFSNQNSNNWKYLLYSKDVQRTFSMTNLKISLGTTLMGNKDILMTTCSSLIIPLVSAVENRKVFEPVQGYNGSFAAASQAMFQFPIMKKDDDALSRICLYFGFENVFAFGNKVTRTFDLKNKPFSRYMTLYDKIKNDTEHGVNVLTKDCDVEPYNFISVITGLRFNYGKAVGEIGYEFWAHAEEKVRIHKDDPWTESRYGIAYIDHNGSLVTETATSQGLTASKSTINYVEFADGDKRPSKSHDTVPAIAEAKYNIYIKESDIDYSSAASQKTYVHRPYVSLGLRSSKKHLDLFLNFGAHISASYHNSALSMWGGWFKAGATF
jgi:hypothetical protein